MSVFVDSSAWYAAADTGDTSHGRAVELLSAGDALVTSDHVLVETWTLLRHRLHRDAAERFWDGLRRGAALLEQVTAADLERAFAMRRDFADQDFSMVDRTSFAVMERLGIHTAVSFDDDFSVYRFGPRRRHAFTVRR